MADQYRPFGDDDTQYTTREATWENLRDVQEIRMRSRVVTEDEKEQVCQSYGWDKDEVCSDELSMIETAERLTPALFRVEGELDRDTLKPGTVFDAMRDFLSEGHGGDDSGDQSATALSQVLSALNGQTSETATKAP